MVSKTIALFVNYALQIYSFFISPNISKKKQTLFFLFLLGFCNLCFAIYEPPRPGQEVQAMRFFHPKRPGKSLRETVASNGNKPLGRSETRGHTMVLTGNGNTGLPWGRHLHLYPKKSDVASHGTFVFLLSKHCSKISRPPRTNAHEPASGIKRYRTSVQFFPTAVFWRFQPPRPRR